MRDREIVFWIATAGLCLFVVRAALIYAIGIKVWSWLTGVTL